MFIKQAGYRTERSKLKRFSGVMIMLSFALSAACANAGMDVMGMRNPTAHNLQMGVGLKGFDPVAIFPEGGGAPAAGDAAFQIEQDGVVYYFSSADNMKLFAMDPAKYEPTYGGWCAYAMANGSQVDIQTNLFTIHGRRAHYFVSSRAKSNFDRDIEDHEGRADGHWKRISGEDPRL